MKNLLFLVCLLAVGVFFTACQKEEATSSEETSALNAYELKMQQLANGEIQLPEIETATLEELNAELTKYGLPTYTEEEVSRPKASSRATIAECNQAQMFGDFNDSGTLSTFDIVLGLREILNCGGTDESIQVLSSELNCVTAIYQDNVAEAAFISFPAAPFDFDRDDLDIMRDAILGNCF